MNKFLFVCMLISYIFADDIDIELELDKMNKEVIDMYKDEWSQIKNTGQPDEMLFKLGILAFYFRLHKAVLPWGREGKGYEHYYPEIDEPFEYTVLTECKELKNCTNNMFEEIMSNNGWLNQASGVSIERELLRTRLIDAQRKRHDISVSQLLCFLTNNRLAPLEHLPFCSYDIREDGRKPMIWDGGAFFQEKYIDEFEGQPFECATRSFCPDPCCSKVPENEQKLPEYEINCAMNLCSSKRSCVVKNFENDNLKNLVRNKFNISCGCNKEPGTIYRPDIGECVHHNPCTKSSLCREPGQECMNILGGFKCVCQLGFYNSTDGKCLPMSIKIPDYHGFSYSEPVHKLQ